MVLQQWHRIGKRQQNMYNGQRHIDFFSSIRDHLQIDLLQIVIQIISYREVHAAYMQLTQ